MASDASRQPPRGIVIGDELWSEPSTSLPTSPGQVATRTNRPQLQLRVACDACNKSKTKCLGGNPCPPCQSSGIRCHYSVAHRLGRPKGSKNKRMVMQQAQESTNNGDTSRSRGQSQPDGMAQAHNSNSGSEKSHHSLMPWTEGSQGQQQQVEHQLLPPIFDHGFHNTGTANYGREDGDNSPLGMDTRDLASMLNHDLLMDAMADDMSDLGHLVPQTQPTQMMMPEAITVSTSPFGQSDDSSVKHGNFHRTFVETTHRSNDYHHCRSTSNNDNNTTTSSPNSSTTRRPSASVYSGNTAFSSGAASAGRIPTSVIEHQSQQANSSPTLQAKSVSASRTPPSAEAPTCTCLSGLVTLLCQLEDLRHPPSPRHTSAHHHDHQHPTNPFSLNCVLRGVQLAEEPWAVFMRCLNASSKQYATQNHAEQDNNGNGHHKQALMLYAMSIRILLSSIHKFCSTIGINVQQKQQRRAGGTDETAAAAAFHSHQRSQREREQQMCPSFVGSAGDVEGADILVSVGGVQITGETRTEIINVAVKQALRLTTAALMRLLERTNRPSSASSAGMVASPTPVPALTPFPMAGYCGRGAGAMMKNPLQNPSHGSLGILASAHTNVVVGQDQIEKGESVAGLLSILQYSMKLLGDGDVL